MRFAMTTIPEKMKVLQIDRYIEDSVESIQGLRVAEKLVPIPGPGQVLVRIEAAPCNPSDLLLLQGRYGVKKQLPSTPGWEGAGTVVAHGGGLMARWLVGKRVACALRGDFDGSWAQYAVVEARTCIPLRDDVSIEQGSTLIINPLTAVGMVETAVEEGHAAIIQTAAASQLGKMVLRLTLDQGIPCINIVRKAEQEKILRELGATIVLNSESENFKEELKKVAHQLRATIAFDAVGGELTGTVFNAMPNNGKILVYGSLSLSACSGIGPLGLIFQCKSIEGFWLTGWLAKKGFWGVYRATKTVQKLMASGAFYTSISAMPSLADAPKALEKYQKDMTAGKVIICPQK
jgi:NADPH:quinone reductase-like Zn-dependent oxidoreductase